LIAVIADKAETEAVQEFFQLFKTPWEFYKAGKVYAVILITCDTAEELNSRLIIICGAEKMSFDSEYGIAVVPIIRNVELEYDGSDIPVKGSISTFESNGQPLIKVKGTHEAAGIEIEGAKKKILRIGYNLFKETHYLLSSAQSKEYVHIPTLDIHIAMLRGWILGDGISLVEIPPVPAGYKFAVCLTHDVDFVGMRRHKFDSTLLGFLSRASFGYFFKVLTGKGELNKLWENWKAVLSLPLVYSGLAEDFWVQFAQYMEIEKGLNSTYFFIPFKKKACKQMSGHSSKRRATKYDITDVRSQVRNLIRFGNEVGLHGIDAWCDAEKGRKEFNRISSVAGNSNVGVRMHWLYFDGRSPLEIEKAGFLYDSTLGYNDCVGYWAGTTQVFWLPGTTNLLELPLHIQDTALFYPKRMGLDENQAFGLCKKLIKNALIYGGVLVINWHQRSLAPERLWGDFYIRLLNNLKEHHVWFATAGEVIRWFQKRREIRFEKIKFTEGGLKLKLSGYRNLLVPDLKLRIYRQRSDLSMVDRFSRKIANYIEIPVEDDMESEIAI
jgi:hypothetical protein